MSFASTLAQIEEDQRWQQYEETWGHLYPKPGDYPGTLVVAHSDYNNQGVTVVSRKFDVEDAPWFYEWMTRFAFDAMAGVSRWVWHTRTGADGVRRKYRSKETVGTRATGIWEFRGVLRVRPSGKACFVGTWTKMDLYPGRLPGTKPRREDAPSMGEILHGRKRRKDPRWRESDDSYFENNRAALVRFLDTMNQRRHGRTGMEPRRKGS